VREHRKQQRGAQDLVQERDPRLPQLTRQEKLRAAGQHECRHPQRQPPAAGPALAARRDPGVAPGEPAQQEQPEQREHAVNRQQRRFERLACDTKFARPRVQIVHQEPPHPR